MSELKKIKKGEEGLKQLHETFRDANWRAADYNFDWLGMERIIDDCLKAEEGSFDRKYEMYGYNTDHDLSEGTISTLKKNDMFIRKNTRKITRAEGKVESSVKYIVISKGEDEKYSIMVVAPGKVDGNMTLHITTNLGMAKEQTQDIDITKDIPKKNVSIFNNAFKAIYAVEDAENKYKEEKEAERRSKEAVFKERDRKAREEEMDMQ